MKNVVVLSKVCTFIKNGTILDYIYIYITGQKEIVNYKLYISNFKHEQELNGILCMTVRLGVQHPLS